MCLLRGVLEPLGVPGWVIEEVEQVPIDLGGSDILRWSCATQGNFSTGSAWELCRHRLPITPVLKLIWNECIMPSVSIFIWRLLANRIPVDAKLQWRKVSLASKCRCCVKPNAETREHLFLRGEVATEVWERLATWFPMTNRRNADV